MTKWLDIRRNILEKQIRTILRAAELTEPGCAITREELVQYVRDHDNERAVLDALDRGALKLIAANAL